jgi:sulfite exporter TauE/SafE
MLTSVISLFILGVSFGSGPCLASCGPLLISFIAGIKENIRRGMFTYVLFSLARIFIYVILANLIYAVGRYTFFRYIWFVAVVRYCASVYIILVGLSVAMGKGYSWKQCGRMRWDVCSQRRVHTLAMGAFIGLLPCAPLIGIFSYIELCGKAWWHVSLCALSFGVGTAVSPLILLVVLTGLFPYFLKNKPERMYRIFSFCCGIIIMLLGIELFVMALKG